MHLLVLNYNMCYIAKKTEGFMIKTIVLDLGGVLAYPVSGNWFIPYNLLKAAGMGILIKLAIKKRSLNHALVTGYEHLKKNHLLDNEDEEYKQFMQFYKIIFKELKINVNEKIIQNFAKTIVYDDYSLKFYDDAVSGIRELKDEYKVIIMADAWPSLKRVLKNNGILELLDGLVLSCNYNERKAGKLFEIAIKEHNLLPEDTLYVDDETDNLSIAEKAGFRPLLMDRRSANPDTQYTKINNLDGIKSAIAQFG